MAYLTKEQRDALKAELDELTFNQANGKIKRMNQHERLAFYRNAIRTGQWATKWVLTDLGTQVTLIEDNVFKDKDKPNRVKNTYQLVEVIVEPTPDNKL
jgi:hypothetical protein